MCAAVRGVTGVLVVCVVWPDGNGFGACARANRRMSTFVRWGLWLWGMGAGFLQDGSLAYPAYLLRITRDQTYLHCRSYRPPGPCKPARRWAVRRDLGLPAATVSVQSVRRKWRVAEVGEGRDLDFDPLQFLSTDFGGSVSAGAGPHMSGADSDDKGFCGSITGEHFAADAAGCAGDRDGMAVSEGAQDLQLPVAVLKDEDSGATAVCGAQGPGSSGAASWSGVFGAVGRGCVTSDDACDLDATVSGRSGDPEHLVGRDSSIICFKAGAEGFTGGNSDVATSLCSGTNSVDTKPTDNFVVGGNGDTASSFILDNTEAIRSFAVGSSFDGCRDTDINAIDIGNLDNDLLFVEGNAKDYIGSDGLNIDFLNGDGGSEISAGFTDGDTADLFMIPTCDGPPGPDRVTESRRRAGELSPKTAKLH